MFLLLDSFRKNTEKENGKSNFAGASLRRWLVLEELVPLFSFSLNLYKAVLYDDRSHQERNLTDYLQTADEKKIKAIYTMVADEINTDDNDWDADFIAELERRSKTFKNGTAKKHTPGRKPKRAALDRVKGNNR